MQSWTKSGFVPKAKFACPEREAEVYQNLRLAAAKRTNTTTAVTARDCPTALCRSICFSPQTIYEICRESRYARYSFVTSVDIMTINGESPLLSSCHNQFFRPQTSSCGRSYMVFSYISSSITSFSYLWCSHVAAFVHPPSLQTTPPYSDRCVRRSCFVFCQLWQ